MACRDYGRYFYLNVFGQPRPGRGYLVPCDSLRSFITHSTLVGLVFVLLSSAILFEMSFSVQIFGKYGVLGDCIRAIFFSAVSMVAIAAVFLMQRHYSSKSIDAESCVYSNVQPPQPTVLYLSLCFFGFVHLRYSFRGIPVISSIGEYMSFIFIAFAIIIMGDYIGSIVRLSRHAKNAHNA